MAKKDKQAAVSPKSPVFSPASMPIVDGSSPEVSCHLLRDERRGIVQFLGEPSTERVWRNCQYPEKITFDQYYRMYARNNVAARVIETFPDYCWANTPFVVDGSKGTSRFSKKVMQFLAAQYRWQDDTKQSLLSLMKQLDVLGGIGGESLLIFGFKDDGKLHEPVKRRKDMEIAWVKLLHNGQFREVERETDDSKANFGDVIFYETVSFRSEMDLNFASQIAPGKKIHASRCVHFRDSASLPYGVSRIQKCYNQLLDITKLSGASAEVYWLGAFSGLSVETDPTAQLEDATYERMKVQVKEYFDGLGRALIFEGAKAKLLYPAIVSPKDHFDLQITMISIATGIPRRFLTGAEAAKLASQQDSLNWTDRVTNRRAMLVSPRIISPVIQRAIDAGVLPSPSEGDFEILWPRIQSIALNERADASRNMTAAWQSYFSSGMSDVVPFRTYLLYGCGFSESEADDIAAKTDLKKAKKMFDAMQKKQAPAEPSSPQKQNVDDDETEDRLASVEAQLERLPELLHEATSAFIAKQQTSKG